MIMRKEIPIAGLCLFLLPFTGCGPIETASPIAEIASPASPEETPPPKGEPTATGQAEAAQLIEIPNAKLPVPGMLVGGQPTPEQLEQAAAAGYVTIVNLRPPGEHNDWDEEAKVKELGLQYLNLPIRSAQDLTAENAILLSKVIDDTQSQPVMVHCASGNRVGALIALKAHFVEGKAAGHAIQQGLDAGLTSLEEAVRERLTESN